MGSRLPSSTSDGDDYVFGHAVTWRVSFVILPGTYLIAEDASSD